MVDRSNLPSKAVLIFPDASQANRRIAGVAAVARLVRELSEAGFAEVWLELPQGEALDQAAIDDVARLAGAMALRNGGPPSGDIARMPTDRLIPAREIPAFLAARPLAPGVSLQLDAPGATAEILRRTGKASDGPVSRWFNRPVSRVLSALLLRVPGFRPLHATAGTAVLALAMFASLVFGGHWGLIAGAVLFQAASVFDGVDGEVARATFRSSSAGAVLDSTVDTATTFLFIIGLATNLVSSGNPFAFALGAWSVGLIALGLGLFRWRARSTNLDRLKEHYRERAAGSPMAKALAFLTMISSRDFFAFANAAAILIGFPLFPLIGFAVSATVWILFVAGWVLLPLRNSPFPAERI